MNKVTVGVNVDTEELNQIELVKGFYGLPTRSSALRFLLHAEAKRIIHQTLGPGHIKKGRPAKNRRPGGC